ncbi:phosphate transport system permease protein [Chelatococcus caeni]|uniref:Phosphate transport system permease protein PstA n=1 Tax=Chelatococcus caeni TaxID=1348468 RepID=A0A840C058_9HYPH|nr:phosphate ABC transporter permease PstA [Chelatococcus caeni]MBB4019191.1 phosphate transport system permease protein [Chelatococcus caeni]
MTDIAAPPPGARRFGLSSDEAQARLRRRHAAEARFRAYGIGAIALAAIFLVVLISDVVVKAMPAFTEYRLTMTVTPTLEQVSSDGTTDPQALRSGDYDAVLRAGLQELFPQVTTRALRRKLNNDLLSSGAAMTLRDRVLADPAVIGQPVTIEALFDDAADLYLKGLMTGRRESAGQGQAQVTLDGEDVVLTSSAPDFARALAEVKESLREEAAADRREAARLTAAAADVSGDQREALQRRIADLEGEAAAAEARAAAADAPERLTADLPSKLVFINGGIVKLTEISASEARGTVLVPLANTDAVAAGRWDILTLTQPEANRRLDDQVVAWLEDLKQRGMVASHFASRFFTSGDSREPEQAGILGALIGSALTMLVTLVLCLPIGVGAAVYLEEFAPKNRLTDLIEVNINNLAAVPSIVFGLLGLAMFLNFFGLPRSAPLVGGLVLALLVLPTIIIASRAALKSVPPSIREAALGIGASHQQAVFHHVLPLAMPGIMTGTIIGMAHALGETAPLLLIGMVAFIVDVPGSITDAATALPVQIYLWSDLPEPLFQAKTAAAILVLLAFLFIMNGLAILLRRRFERRW